MELRLYFKQLRQTYSFTACLYSASSKSELSDPLFLMTSFFPYFNDASISESILKCQYLRQQWMSPRQGDAILLI